jgi:hypothetical protein
MSKIGSDILSLDKRKRTAFHKASYKIFEGIDIDKIPPNKYWKLRDISESRILFVNARGEEERIKKGERFAVEAIKYSGGTWGIRIMRNPGDYPIEYGRENNLVKAIEMMKEQMEIVWL